MSSTVTRNPNLDLFPAVRPVNQSDSWQQNLGRDQISSPRDATWWTGVDPSHGLCAGKNLEGYIEALPTLDLRVCTRKEVQDYFDNGWLLTELLFSSLTAEEAFYRPPYHELRHPLVFYYVHPAVLYVNKLHMAGLLDQTLDPEFERLFEVGVDEMSWDDLSKNFRLWPDLSACRNYRRKAYTIVRSIIANHPGLSDQRPLIGRESPLWSLFMGFEHERIHLETSSVLIRELPVHLVQRPKYFSPLFPAARPLDLDKLQAWTEPEAGRDYPGNSWLELEPGKVEIGRGAECFRYGWDNEFGHELLSVAAFSAQRLTVSNGEFFQFVVDGGYREARFWSEDGWRWRSFRNSKVPCFWVPLAAQGVHRYALRTCFEIIAMPWDWPVVINYYEAKAFAAWKSERLELPYGLRLMTEAEHHRIRQSTSSKSLTIQSSLLHLKYGSEGPVDLGEQEGFCGVFGNVWQWLEDHFHPLPGFEPHPLYDDFSTPCFDGLHQMIMGGSFMSTGEEAEPGARFHFRPHFFQHAGFRLVDPLLADNDGAVRVIAEALKPQTDATAVAKAHSPFEWDSHQLTAAFHDVGVAAADFWQKLVQLNPAGIPKPPAKLGSISLTEPLSEQGTDFGRLLPELVSTLRQGQVVGHPGYFAYLAGAANPVAALGQALAMLINPYTGTEETAPLAVQLENQVIRWLLDMMGMPSSGGGLITTGSSLAIFSAVIAARERAQVPFGRRRVYVSDQAHHCISKALFGAGFVREEIVVLPSEDGRLLPGRVKTQIEQDRLAGWTPILLFATAGSTPIGRVDPLWDLAELAAEQKLWYHVDAAYGGFFRLISDSKVLRGLERADSLSLDPHKSLYMPYGTGVLLVRDARSLQWPRGFDSSYMMASDPAQPMRNFTDISPELSRDFRGLRLWLSLKVFGLSAYRQQLEEKRQLALTLAKAIEAEPALELTAAPDLSLLAFRVRDDVQGEKTMALLNQINASGHFYLSTCRWQGRQHIRVCILSFRTSAATIAELMQLITQSLERVKR